MRRFFLKGIYPRDRLHGIEDIREAVRDSGFIVDHKMYSDISMSFTIETEERKFEELLNCLSSVISLEDSDKQLHRESSKEIQVLLNVTFIAGTGDVRNRVPAIPG